MAHDSDRYEVGYGKPPRHTRFKKGQSGNPGGGRRKSAPPGEIAASLLARKVTVTSNGKKRKITAEEAMYMAQIQKALKGDHRATKLLLELRQSALPPDPIQQTPKEIISMEELVKQLDRRDLNGLAEIARELAKKQ